MIKRHILKMSIIDCRCLLLSFSLLLGVGYSNGVFAEPLAVIPGENPNLFGMDTPAGSGRHLSPPSTNICKVTNLNDAGEGSLRYCVEVVPSPKTIVFEVSGNIELTSHITIGGLLGQHCDNDPSTAPSSSATSERIRVDTGNYLTIAGQTAPSPGVTLKNYGFVIERMCHDILVQHLRIRPGDTSFYDLGCHEEPKNSTCKKPSIADPLTLVGAKGPSRGEGPPWNIVIDHNSFTWGGDMSIQSGADYITFTNNLISESLNSPLHPKGPHSKGLYSIAYNEGASGGHYTAIVKNLISHSVDRNPTISTGYAVVANNYLYDVGPIGAIMVDDTSDKKGTVLVAIDGNYMETSSRVADNRIVFRSRDYYPSKYFVGENNSIDGALTTDPWNSDLVNKCHNWGGTCDPMPPEKIALARQDAIWVKEFTPMPVEDVPSYVRKNAGARPADRDPVDARIIAQAETKHAHIIESQDDVGGWPALAQNYRALVFPQNPHAVQPSGYTALEEWLHGFADAVEGEKIPNPERMKFAN